LADPPYGAILLLGILSILSAVLSIRQARRKGERIHYMGAVVGFLMLSVFALALLNQALLAFVLLVVGGMLCIAALPRVITVQRREMAEQLEKQLREVDFSAPLRARDLLAWKGWLKLAHRWGVRKTATIYSLISLAFVATVLFTILSTLGIMNPWYVVGFAVASAIASFVWFYRQIGRALERSKTWS